MEFSLDEAKRLFIREVLDQHGDYLSDILVDDISDKNIIDKGALLSSISFKINQYGQNYALIFNFPGYGRMVEINFHKRKRGNTRDTIKQLYKIQSREDVLERRAKRQRKDLRWYSHNVYGSLNTLYARLSSEFTDDEISRLKKIIENSSYTGTNSGILTTAV